MDCIVDKGKRHCTCTYTNCPHHGRCCACVANHRHKQEVPGCFFTKEGEALWDRSRAAFLRDQAAH